MHDSLNFGARYLRKDLHIMQECIHIAARSLDKEFPTGRTIATPNGGAKSSKECLKVFRKAVHSAAPSSRYSEVSSRHT